MKGRDRVKGKKNIRQQIRVKNETAKIRRFCRKFAKIVHYYQFRETPYSFCFRVKITKQKVKPTTAERQCSYISVIFNGSRLQTWTWQRDKPASLLLSTTQKPIRHSIDKFFVEYVTWFLPNLAIFTPVRWYSLLTCTALAELYTRHREAAYRYLTHYVNIDIFRLLWRTASLRSAPQATHVKTSLCCCR